VENEAATQERLRRKQAENEALAQERLLDLQHSVAVLEREEVRLRELEVTSKETIAFEDLVNLERVGFINSLKASRKERVTLNQLVINEDEARNAIEADWRGECDHHHLLYELQADEVAREVRKARNLRQAAERVDKERTEALFREDIHVQEREEWNSIMCSQCVEWAFLEYCWALDEDCVADAARLYAEEAGHWHSLAKAERQARREHMGFVSVGVPG
jgi:hypothetical protein